jgi:putative cell wall-binding protein
MKSVKRKGLALAAVSSSVLGLGAGMAGTASAEVWQYNAPGPTVDLAVHGTVNGTGASAVLSVSTDNTGSTGYAHSTDFGDGTKPVTTPTATHAYAAGALKQTLTQSSLAAAGDTTITSTMQVGVDATDPAHIAYTRSVPIDLAAQGAVVTSGGNSSLDLGKVLPAGADLGSLTGTCDAGPGAPAFSIDAKTKLASCDWTGPDTADFHTITLTYTDKTTGLISTSQERVEVPYQPVATFRVAVLAKGLVQLDVTGSTMNDPGAGIIDWGDGSTTSVSLPLHNNALQTHQYTELAGGPRTITFSVTDRFGEHASTTAKVDDFIPTVDYSQLTRYAGATRYGTGVAASQAAFPFAGTADSVVLARGDVYADALAGIPLAKLKSGPLLLTPGGPAATTLDPRVAAEIKRVLPSGQGKTVYILGGTAAIPQAVQDYIKNTLGYNVERFAGATRYDTALTVAQNPDALHDPANIVVARGDDFADALASGPLAADRMWAGRYYSPAAIVLSTGNGITGPASLTPETAKYVAGKLNGAHATVPTGVTAVGGGAVKAVSAIAASPKAFTAIAGADRYATAAKVAAAGWGTTPSEVGVASGTNFPDSLTGGAMMAAEGYPLLLSDPNATSPALSPATGSALTAAGSALMNTELFGGTQVFTDGVAQDIMRLEGMNAAHYRVVQLPF